MDEKIALVTGAGMGIGASIASVLVEDGYMAVVSDVQQQAATETAQRILAAGFNAWPLIMDVGSASSISDGFASLSGKFGRCDVLVNNAGIAKTFPLLDYPMDHWELVMRVNVTGPMLCAQHAAKLMRARQWGRIVNLTSISGMRASAGRAAYGTSKAALIGLTRQMAIELAPHGITANAVSPGPIDTLLARAHHSEATRANYIRAIPAHRYGTPDEVASAVSYLASEAASFVNGHILPVDGGFMAAGLLDI